MLAPEPTGFKILGGNNYSTGNIGSVLLFKPNAIRPVFLT